MNDKELENLLNKANWPKASPELKNRIMLTTIEDDAFIFNYKNTENRKYLSAFLVAFALCFMIGSVTGSYSQNNLNDYYLYNGAGSLMTYEIFK